MHSAPTSSVKRQLTSNLSCFLRAALGANVAVWPPYLSNLVFELWEMETPPPPPRSKMNTSSSSSSKKHGGGGGGGAKQQQQDDSATSAATDAGPFVVRVLYNKEPVALVELPNGGKGGGGESG